MKRQKANDGEGFIPRHGLQFSKEEIDAEGKRPKRKVAVLMGYSGTGYKGMQLQVSRMQACWKISANEKKKLP